MSAQEKDAKPPRAGAPQAPPAAKKPGGAGRLDLDMEELSGSLLVDESTGKGAKFVSGPSSVAPARAPNTSPPAARAQPRAPSTAPKSASPRPPSVAPKSSIPAPLPRPNPPPKPNVEEPRRSEPRPPSLQAPASDDAVADKLQTTMDLSDQAVTRVQPALQPPPATPPMEDDAEPIDDDVEVTALPDSMLSPWKANLKSAVRSTLQAAGTLAQRASALARQTPAVLRRVSSLVQERAAGSDLLRKRGMLVIAGCGLLAGVGLVALTISAARHRHEALDRPAASAVAEVAPPTPSEGPGAAAAENTNVALAPPPAATAGPCRVTGDPRLVGQSATVAAGVEARALGTDVALGFAPSEHQAMLLRLNPTSAAALDTTQARVKDPVARVTPLPGKSGKLALAIDLDRKGDALSERRTVPLDPPVQLGVADSHLAWAPLNRSAAGTLWALEGDDPVDALRGTRSESNPVTVAVALRRSGAIWIGTADVSPSLSPKGELSRIPSLGQAGTPAVVVNDGVVLVAWADRPSPDAPWRLRWVRFKVGEPPGAPVDFAPPAGGKGEQAMSPSLAVAPGGHFILVWTEGPASAHDVRALTLSEDGAPLGAPLDISRESMNAGQGQAAIASSGRGVVAFLRASGGGFQVVATPIECPL